ncbi:hypothetical protein Cgig2_018001 [Carnegiea gigantea]|uniref:Uncharacterized protein n=1 Tax=Carnegiea gigantea TaxID=171969 RepID=A0A9Q1JK62_9CARY|nr:hypothetical protein Cgig2_018001 [Carnegiea gigantea]
MADHGEKTVTGLSKRRLTELAPKPGMTGEVNHSLNVICNAFPTFEECSRSSRLGVFIALLTAERGSRVIVPTIVFDGREGPYFASSHNDPLVVEMKVASAIVRRILINTFSSVDIITEIIPLVHPILGFRGHEVNPTEMIHLLLRLGDKVKAKARNLEVDFLVVDVLTDYIVILGRPTLHKVKAIIASYLLQLQFEANDGSVGKLQGD